MELKDVFTLCMSGIALAVTVVIAARQHLFNWQSKSADVRLRLNVERNMLTISNEGPAAATSVTLLCVGAGFDTTAMLRLDAGKEEYLEVRFSKPFTAYLQWMDSSSKVHNHRFELDPTGGYYQGNGWPDVLREVVPGLTYAQLRSNLDERHRWKRYRQPSDQRR